MYGLLIFMGTSSKQAEPAQSGSSPADAPSSIAMGGWWWSQGFWWFCVRSQWWKVGMRLMSRQVAQYDFTQWACSKMDSTFWTCRMVTNDKLSRTAGLYIYIYMYISSIWVSIVLVGCLKDKPLPFQTYPNCNHKVLYFDSHNIFLTDLLHVFFQCHI